jgi:polyphosphate kinase
MPGRAEAAATEEPNWRDAYQDRDEGWLAFNSRVLHEALDPRTPLLERVKFLAIVASNLDEFFMKRVGLFQGRFRLAHASAIARADAAQRHLAEIRQRVLPMLQTVAACFQDDLLPQLAEHKIHLLCWEELTAAQQDAANAFFLRNVSPALTPLALDPGHPFPYLSNLSASLGFVLRCPDSDENLFARVKIPSVLPDWIPLRGPDGDSGRYYVALQDLIQHNADQLFPGMDVLDCTWFRVTRNAEVDLDDEDADSLATLVASELRHRRFAPVVRLELGPDPNPWVRGLLMRQFELSEQDVYELPYQMDYTGLWPIAGLGVPSLSDPPWSPVVPALLQDEDADVFSVIRAGDVLVHHPYECFDASVERFIRSAADDPSVVAIKMTVYRVGDDTPFVKSLIRAAESGKQVACLIELQARFDEERNLHWAQELEKIGCHVVYGVMGLKTHTKIALVVRKESDGLRCYAHIGTGNYHVKTARLYTDLGLLTCDPEITDDIVNLFHYLTGRSRTPQFRRLLVAPMNMRDRFIEMIQGEIDHHRAGRRARIIAKMNQLEDPAMCQAICQASQAGVPVDLMIRGFSCLIAGVPGVSENVRIRSVIGRFLEHSRIFYFAAGESDPLNGDFYIGSADWMNRNLSKRVEAITPIQSRSLRERLWEILGVTLADRRQAWEMQPDGSYIHLTPPDDAEGAIALGTHATLMRTTRRRRARRIVNAD